MLTFCTAPDERIRCCVVRGGRRCAAATSWRFILRGAEAPGHQSAELECYTFTCSDCAAEVAAQLGSQFQAVATGAVELATRPVGAEQQGLH